MEGRKMDKSDAPINFCSLLRCMWIDAYSYRNGVLNRSDICEAFGISVPAASIALRDFQARYPEALEYDRSAKTYRRKFRMGAVFKTSRCGASPDILELVRIVSKERTRQTFYLTSV